jgi:2-polyprenyl-6-methoxyphenol hydroxylase-like FAD-dependent oxidoreductase
MTTTTSKGVHDVVIVGGGPVGASLALALADADLDVVLVDARHVQTTLRADRTLAVSHGARLVLERLGLWGELVAHGRAPTPIREIDISQAGGFGQVRLTAKEQRLPALGYVVSYRALQAGLDRALRRTHTALRYGYNVTCAGGTRAYGAVVAGPGSDPVLARLVVVADGAGAHVAGIERSPCRRRSITASSGLHVRTRCVRSWNCPSPRSSRSSPHASGRGATIFATSRNGRAFRSRSSSPPRSSRRVPC